jgi:hypothetical protein
MKHTAQIALTVLLVSFAAACHKDNKVAQLKALDEAYKSGVFSKEEYDAKRQALLGALAATPAPAAPAPTAAPPAPAGASDPGSANPSVTTPPVSAPPVSAPTAVTSPSAAPVQTVPPRSSAPPAYTPPPTQAAPPVYAPPPTAPPRAAQSAPVAPQESPQATPQAPAEPDEPEPAPLAGCQDAESRPGGRNVVQERFFPVSEDLVRQAATRAFTSLDFIIHSSSGNEIEASKKRHLSAVVGAGGERVILHLSSAQQSGQAGTRVTAQTKKSIVGRVSQKSWTTAVLAQIGCNIRGGF